MPAPVPDESQISRPHGAPRSRAAGFLAQAGRRQTALAAGLIVLAIGAAYYHALSTPFVFDDQFAIVENPSIRHLGRLGAVLSPPPSAAGAAGRPFVNLTLAANYALGGLNPWGYHAFNVAIHLLAALTLFGIVRRALGWSALSPTRLPADGAAQRVGDNALHPTIIAFLIALVWSVHPLLSESVTGVVQRDELLGSLFYLLTLYCFIRGVERVVPNALNAVAGRTSALGTTRSTSIWFALSIAACLLGVFSKEIIVSAPLIVLLYDRTFVSGAFRAAWRRHRGLYLGLAATWLPLAALMLNSQQRGGTVGFGLGVSSWDYLLTQCRAIAIYLKLTVWPHPLVIDYGTDLVRHASEVALPGIALLLLAAATLVSLRRPSAAGFLGAVFFAILAPSSSVVPLVSQPIAEHRMYLPLAALVALAVTWGGARCPQRAVRLSLFLWPLLALVLLVLTVRRNADYRSEVTLTEGALAANPHNDRAYLNLGTFASRRGKWAEAIDDYQTALRLNPGAADTQFNLAVVLEQAGRRPEALVHYQEAVRLRPAFPVAQYRLGLALVQAGRAEAALGPLTRARELQPDSSAVRTSLAQAHRDLGNALAQAGRLPEAATHYEAALALEPGWAQVHNNLANLLSQEGRPAEAIAHYEAALRGQPDYAEAHYNLAIELLQAGRTAEAAAHLRAAVRLNPGDDQARRDLARIEALMGP